MVRFFIPGPVLDIFKRNVHSSKLLEKEFPGAGRAFIAGQHVGYFTAAVQHIGHESFPPGRHHLTAKSKKGKAALDKEFEISDEHWAVIDYWYYPKLRGGSGPTPRKFGFMIQDSPIGFQ